jgi:hypothetical protein
MMCFADEPLQTTQLLFAFTILYTQGLGAPRPRPAGVVCPFQDVPAAENRKE